MHEFAVLVILGPMVAAATLLAVFFLPAFPLLDVPGFPEPLHRSLVRELRLAGFVVAEGKDQLSVRIGPVSAVRIHLCSTVEGTQLRYRPDATPSGWTLVLGLIFLGAYGLTAFAAVALVMYVAFRANGFARERLAPLAAKLADPEPPARPEATALLVDGLSEAYRIATEAYEAERSRYGDRELLAALGALALWTGLFFGHWLTGSPLWVSIAWATASALAVFVAAGVFVWRSFRPRREEYRRWSDRLRAAWTQASGSGGVKADGLSLLAEASERVPAWLQAARRAGFLRDPHAYVVPVALGFSGYWMLWASVWFVLELATFALAVALAVAGVGLLAGAVLLHRRWVRVQEVEELRSAEAWTRRYEAIRARLASRGNRAPRGP